MTIFNKALAWFNNSKSDSDDIELVEDSADPNLKQSFRMSKPFGYYMKDVDDFIKNLRYQLQNEIREKGELQKKLTEANHQILKMQFEMSTMEVPSIGDEIGQSIISAAESKLNVKPNEKVKRMKEKHEEIAQMDDDTVFVSFD